MALPTLFVLVSAFLVDAGWTLLLRLWRREPFWQAHSQHLYQRLVRHGMSHASVCCAYAIWTCTAVAAAWSSQNLAATGKWGVALAFYGVGSLVYCMLTVWRPLAPGAGSPK